jgi:hypothetical protein
LLPTIISDRGYGCLRGTCPSRVESLKLSPHFIGPFPISKVLSPTAVRLLLPHTLRIHPTFHVSRIKPCLTVLCLLFPGPPHLPSHRRPSGVHGETPPEGSTSGQGFPVPGLTGKVMARRRSAGSLLWTSWTWPSSPTFTTGTLVNQV